MTTTPTIETTLAACGRRMGFDTMETRNSDALDFREVGVASAREALRRAYEAGRAAANTALLDAAACVVACHDGGTEADHYELVTAMEELKAAVEASRNAPGR